MLAAVAIAIAIYFSIRLVIQIVALTVRQTTKVKQFWIFGVAISWAFFFYLANH